MPHQDTRAWLHFVGVGGSGMSALAQFHVGRGGRATGSDRAFDASERGEIRDQLLAAGVEIHPQDGRILDETCSGVVSSRGLFSVSRSSDARPGGALSRAWITISVRFPSRMSLPRAARPFSPNRSRTSSWI